MIVKPIPNFPGYFASKDGQIWSKRRMGCQAGIDAPAESRSLTQKIPMVPGTVSGRVTSQAANWSNTPKTVDDGQLSGGARRLVEVLIKCRPAAFTKAQWASLADLSHTSGTFGTYLSKIRSMGLVEESGGLFRPTNAAIEMLGGAPIEPPRSNEDVVEMWKRALGGTPAKMVEVVRDQYPNHISREELAQQVGITHTSGTFGTYFSKLRSNGLVEVRGDSILASPTLLWEP